MGAKADNLVWIDLEMTGLDSQRDRIIEIATIVTDTSLAIVAEGPVLAIHQEVAALEAMDDWNKTTHSGSGLLQRVRASQLDAAEAERRTLAFLELHAERGASPMCGNSICQDRRFLAREMPALEKFFHYRNLDVSSLKELAKRWHPEVYSSFRKQQKHTALADVHESIDELAHYREHFLKLPAAEPVAGKP